MANRLIVAGAGAGKSLTIVKEALSAAAVGERVLLLSYTVNNQLELLKHLCNENRCQPPSVVIKGWFSFLLEDLVRPYQSCIVPKRIAGIHFDNRNPHIVNNIHRPGRGERTSDGKYNPAHFVSQSDNLAYTTFLSQLATRIHEVTDGSPTRRLARIYKHVFVDEVQDLVSWDFNVLDAVSESQDINVTCVGDFRQTIYQTTVARRRPTTISEKLAAFELMAFGRTEANVSRRCIQSICDLADRVHETTGLYCETKSLVEDIPSDVVEHCGVFAVQESCVSEYVDRYKPVILRWERGVKADLCRGRAAYNFGEAKGMGFDRILILPTEKQRRFLAGNLSALDAADAESARNRLYVAITRARYSVAFLHEGSSLIPGATWWDASRG